MKIPARRTRGESGQALITAIIFLLALTFMGFGLVAMSTVDVSSARNLRLAEESLSAAEEGIALGMSYAGNVSTNFISQTTMEGTTVRLKSNINGGKSNYDRMQYDVMVTMGGPTELPPGEQTGKSSSTATGNFTYVTVKIDALGLVGEGTGSGLRTIASFDWMNRPMISKSIVVIVRVKKPT